MTTRNLLSSLSRKGLRLAFSYGLAALLLGNSNTVSAQTASPHVNPWAPTELGPLPPVASLSDGLWLKGELHLHSSHSKDGSNNSIGKIIGFCDSVGIDFLAITDH